MKLDKQDLVVLMAHWCNEAGMASADDEEYEKFCMSKARKFQKALERMYGVDVP